MKDSHQDPKAGKPAPSEGPRRIQTQIHRRQKAKAVYPLTNEWEESGLTPPKGLRMPSEKMKKH